ncbi:helix-turn-helix domain-containing protein [Tissierella praeacuta]|uniref:AraC-type DNA-binding protein n=1 Tax=Tissierella praeacuta DSM 18095 TaxID=1123404 RepID=A0A1M4TUM6_9FIRM|nr:AraC family transcriptional regulator [Tissierella praeacuta]TCU77336.1 AraC family transcriptional regulator [Tissierella praeacuta]SHE48128.1 AraC-type DNA-binding protein [Tissierella praeacuta DSM 18095]SUP04285.1 Methylphosphotriester-DNA--protein-cysteine S-methyltransferase [Tissierella praeacuta]
MRKEHAEYMKDLPINIFLANIMEYPIHWRDSIQILFVLNGTIDVGVENEIYTLYEREIEIINVNEVYSIKSNDPKNLVLILNIDPNFFERYYDDAKEIFFYTNSSDEHVQEDEKYYELRKYISILLYEAVSKLDDYEDKIEENLLEMMYHLLNNFHYLFYESEGLEDDEEQLERYHRIVKYLSNNYMNKVSLQEIADKEFLSSQYLSYKIKDILGHGFNEYLNQIRVEESTKLLLDSDRNISEISEEVGFSHVRYYNKHFKLHYNCTPMQYRKKYKVSEEELENMTKIKYFNIKEALPYITGYIEDYERYDYDNRIIKIDIDLNKDTMEKYRRPDIIDLGDIYLLLEEENRRILEEIQREIKFKYCIVNRLFSEDMDIYRDKSHKFINWTRVENILDILIEQDLTPIIITENVEKYIIDDFINHFSNLYEEDVEKWLNINLEELEPYFPKNNISKVQDTISMVSYILYNYIHLHNRVVLNMVDEISKETILNNDTFFGGNGIFTSNYLKKPSYYAYMLLSLLGDTIIDKGEGYIVTKSEYGYQIMLFNPIEIDEEIIYNDLPIDKIKERKVSLNILNMENDFQVTKYVLDRNFGSVYDKWVGLNKPERLDNDNWELLKEYVHPNISFYYGKKSTVYNTIATIKPYGAILFVLNNVLNS